MPGKANLDRRRVTKCLAASVAVRLRRGWTTANNAQAENPRPTARIADSTTKAFAALAPGCRRRRDDAEASTALAVATAAAADAQVVARQALTINDASEVNLNCLCRSATIQAAVWHFTAVCQFHSATLACAAAAAPIRCATTLRSFAFL